jgi:hypothetical protein
VFDIFEKYKDIDLKILESIEQDKENIELLESREKIINEMLSLDIEKDEIKMKYEELGLDKLDEEIGQSLKDKMNLVKRQIKKIKIAKKANRGYASAQRGQSVFSQKI